MNLSKFFIDRPIFAGVLSLLMFLGGLISVRGLPISEYPEVVPPSIVVRAQYPGANPARGFAKVRQTRKVPGLAFSAPRSPLGFWQSSSSPAPA